jgi:hypothetical protein
MVIDDFHVVRVAASPAKADAVLVIDADAVLPLSWFSVIWKIAPFELAGQG